MRENNAAISIIMRVLRMHRCNRISIILQILIEHLPFVRHTALIPSFLLLCIILIFGQLIKLSLLLQYLLLQLLRLLQFLMQDLDLLLFQVIGLLYLLQHLHILPLLLDHLLELSHLLYVDVPDLVILMTGELEYL